MHIWRSLPEGQLLAVLRWMSSRRKRQGAGDRLATETPTLAPDTGDKAASPTR